MNPEVSRAADQAEALFQDGRFPEAQETLEKCLEKETGHPRGRLLLGRVLFHQGKFDRALEAIRPLESMQEVKVIADKLKRLLSAWKGEPSSAFLTASMGDLLVRQGYLREALLVFLRLFYATPKAPKYLREIQLLQKILVSRGSEKAEMRLTNAEIEALDRWIQERGG